MTTFPILYVDDERRDERILDELVFPDPGTPTTAIINGEVVFLSLSFCWMIRATSGSHDDINEYDM